MSTENLIAKVQRLLALGKSPNTHEAEAAMAKATELMTRHNLTLQAVEAHKRSDYITMSRRVGKRITKTVKLIGHLLDRFFFVRVVFERGGDAPVLVYLMGKPENVEVASYTFAYLRETLPRLWKEARTRYGFTARQRDDFYLGIHAGLQDKLERERTRVQQELALVVVRDEKLDEAMDERFGAPKSTKLDTSVGSMQAAAIGYQQGKRLELRAGLDGSETKRQEALT